MFATAVLLMYTRTVGDLADEASDPTAPASHLRELGRSPVLHAGLALGVLLVATVLAVFKPQGLTTYGRRRLRQERGG